MSKTVIVPHKSAFKLDLKAIYDYRGLLWSLAWRDFRVKYAQTFIGLSWAVINPLFTLLILTFVFGMVAKVDTDGVPHILFTIAGLSAWTYFSTLLTDAGNSVVASQHMIQKIYFPRIIIPLSKAITGLIDLGITLLILLFFLFYYQVIPGKEIIYLPVFIFLAILSGLAGGIWVSALTVRYRDFKFITPFVVRLGLYASPVAFAASSVPEKYQWLFNLNPMVGVIEGFRWSLLGTTPYFSGIYMSAAIIVLLFITGILYFNKMEKVMSDII